MTVDSRGGIALLNAMPEPDAMAWFLGCCASKRWASEVAAGRPYADGDALLAAGRDASAALDWPDVHEAMLAHPPIGERPAGSGRDATWSRAEQSGMDSADDRVRAELAAANRAYADRFGHVFLICATGLSSGQMLVALRARLGNSPEAERALVRTELIKIVRLRLAKALR